LTSRRSNARRGASEPRAEGLAHAAVAYTTPPDYEVRPATREETFPVTLAAVAVGFVALIVCFSKGYLLLYGDAVAHLGIARRIFDSRNLGLAQLGGVWLPLPHLLMLPLVEKMEWWRNGLAGAWPSLACYIVGVAGFYRLGRRMLSPRWALAATAFYGMNPNLLYLSTTAMTEPLFLALLIWITLLTTECVAAIRAGQPVRVAWRLAGLGWLMFAAVFTRYDGWVLGAVVWCVVTWQLGRARALWRSVVPAFAVFTLLALAGPVLWLWYNQHFFHDPLDFLRGPYSAPAIEKKTSPPGSKHYRGWHNLGWALLFYTRTAQVDAAVWETGFGLMAAALAGVWIALRRRVEPAALLLWLPLAFYVYSIAYGSVPIFIPQLYPHSYYNSRYGMELLPALVLFALVAAAALERWARARAAAGAIASRLLHPAIVVLVVLNSLGMIYGTQLVQQVARLLRRPYADSLGLRYRAPLVLQEGLVNATTRVAFERSLARAIEDFPPGVSILMQNSDHIGALEDAGIPLRQTVNEGEYYSWRAALEDPAGHAAYVIAIAGDPVSKAVAEHPEGLQELTILCTTGQPCARIYQSTRFTPSGAAPVR
jgi:hypothetical protein